MEFLVAYATQRTNELIGKYKLDTKATDTGVLARVDWDAGIITPIFEYRTPVENRHPDLRVTFKAGHITSDELLLPTSTEILVFSRGDWQLKEVVSLPQFNDLHHVIVSDSEWIVCNTGLDSLVWLDANGNFIRQEVLLDSDVPTRYGLDMDFRQLFSTKPHNVHPNYLFHGPAGELFVTCFFQKRAVNVADSADYYPIDVGNPHDGLLHDGKVYFTTTNGHVVICDAFSRKQIEILDIPAILGEERAIGWCRGLHIKQNRLFIGFSKIRETKSKEFIRWIRNGLKWNNPSQIVEIDLVTKKKVKSVLLPDEDSPIFDLIPLNWQVLK